MPILSACELDCRALTLPNWAVPVRTPTLIAAEVLAATVPSDCSAVSEAVALLLLAVGLLLLLAESLTALPALLPMTEAVLADMSSLLLTDALGCGGLAKAACEAC